MSELPIDAICEALHYFGAHRPDSPRHSAWVALDKFLEGDPVEVHPPESLAGSQAGLNGSSGSPTSHQPEFGVETVSRKAQAVDQREPDGGADPVPTSTPTLNEAVADEAWIRATAKRAVRDGRTAIPLTHETRIAWCGVPTGDGYRARCSCGWMGEPTPMRSVAAVDELDHLREAATKE